MSLKERLDQDALIGILVRQGRLDVSLRYLPSEYGAGREVRLSPRGDRWDEAAREGLLDRERWQDALHPGN